MHASNVFRGRVALVTGASSGIGEELARQLAAAGARLALAARRTELLEILAAEIAASGADRPLVLGCDVTRDGDPERAVAATVAHFGKLDIAVANAGFGVVGAFAELSVADYRRQFETNVFGVLRTLKAALPAVLKTRGQLVVTGSVAGWVATPGTSPYSMSKFALRALASAVTPELARSGVAVTLVSPGFIESAIRRVDNQGRLHRGSRDPIPAWLVMDRRKAVRQILRAVARRRREVIVTAHGKLAIALERFAPWLIRYAGRRLAAGRGAYRSEAGAR
ncbi:MAG TPA: SDR family NAD(P)-dependent oxidoreductase [Steroidobacteraceae bacterium]|nr:SDR family NAD(P)-dependent oxidoreductase [Steroidobacteraceae bacterium]